MVNISFRDSEGIDHVLLTRKSLQFPFFYNCMFMCNIFNITQYNITISRIVISRTCTKFHTVRIIVKVIKGRQKHWNSQDTLHREPFYMRLICWLSGISRRKKRTWIVPLNNASNGSLLRSRPERAALQNESSRYSYVSKSQSYRVRRIAITKFWSLLNKDESSIGAV